MPRVTGTGTTPRYIFPFGPSTIGGATSQIATIGRVYLTEMQITHPVTVDAIIINNGTTAAGNVTVGVYGPLATEDTCAGAAVAIQSASTAQSGTSAPQIISLTATKLVPGRYYVAMEFSDGTATFLRRTGNVLIVGWSQYYDRGGGYGALTDPCPSITAGNNPDPVVVLRCVVT